MAVRQIRIGSMEDIHQYDDGDYGTAVETDQPVSIGPSTVGDEAVRQDQLPGLGTIISSDAVITDHAIVRGDGGARKIQDSSVTIDDSGNILIATNAKLNLRDSAIGLYSQADTFLDLFADGAIRIGDSSGGAPTNYINIAPDGEITFVGTARTEKKFSVSPGSVKLGEVSPTEAVIGVTPVLRFSQAVTQSVHGIFHIPNDWDPTTDITVHVHWAPATGAAGDVVWDMDYTSLASNNNEVLTAASTNITVTDSTETLQDEVLESSTLTFIAANLALEDIASFQFYRDTADGNDTYNASASFVRLDFEYTSRSRGTAL